MENGKNQVETSTASIKRFSKRWLWLIPLVILGLVTCFIMMKTAKPKDPEEQGAGPSELKAYDDVRTVRNMTVGIDISNMDLADSASIVPTLWFNETTRWPEMMPKECDPHAILEAAKNPGLGVRALHSQGITGEGVAVAIIDQPLYQDHPEFAGKIAMYRDFDCKSESSMHGPAVTSLLVGEDCGTAPGAKVYYAAAPSWHGDAKYYADALDWIVSVNKDLPEEEKIRVVSVSAAPSGRGSPFKNGGMWDKSVANAQEEGILVLDCTEVHGIIASCWYDTRDPESVQKCMPGFPGRPPAGRGSKYICAPASPRTTAEEYVKGDFSYQYTGRGGLSWSIPYAAGVLALGWQIDPDLTSDEAVDLLFESAYRFSESTNIIDPAAFISLVRARDSK